MDSSTKIKPELAESVRQLYVLEHKKFEKAGEMIEMMKRVRADSHKRMRQLRKMIKACNFDNARELKHLYEEMGRWKKYTIT